MRRFAIIAMLAGSLAAQSYPWPGRAGAADVICSTCAAPYTGLKTTAYVPPIEAHAGRFLDSQATQDYHVTGYGPRTLRAWHVRFVPELDRVYMILGSHLAAYRLSDLFARRLGRGLVPISPERQFGPAERYLPWDFAFDAETQGQGWVTRMIDGQERLWAFDTDDRGYVYLAYSEFGWGILRDHGNAFSLVSQVEGQAIQQLGVNPKGITAARSGLRYYALVTDPSAPAKVVVFDVTDASAPRLTRILDFGFTGAAKAAGTNGDAVALVGRSAMRIYAASALVAGADPLVTFSGSFAGVTSDGSRFYGVNRGPMLRLSVIAPGDSGYTLTPYVFAVALSPVAIRHGGGHLTVTGFDAMNRPGVHVFQVGGGSAPKLIDTGNFISKYYGSPPEPGYARPAGYMDPKDGVTYRYGGKDYLFFSCHGLGDVYVLVDRGWLEIAMDFCRDVAPRIRDGNPAIAQLCEQIGAPRVERRPEIF